MAAISKGKEPLPLLPAGDGARLSAVSAACRDDNCSCVAVACVWITVLAMILLLLRWSWNRGDLPLYSVAITAVSGVDAAAALAGHPIDPVFDVNVTIISRSGREECVDPAASVHVSYFRRVSLATGRVWQPDGGQICKLQAKSLDRHLGQVLQSNKSMIISSSTTD